MSAVVLLCLPTRPQDAPPPDLPEVRIVWPASGMRFQGFPTPQAEVLGELPAGARLQWWLDGAPVSVSEPGGVPHFPLLGDPPAWTGYHALAVQALDARDNPGPLSAPVWVWCAFREGDANGYDFTVTVLWPENDSVLPTRADQPDHAEVSLLVKTEPPVDPDKGLHVTVPGAENPGFEVVAPGILWVQAELRGLGRHVVHVRIATETDPFEHPPGSPSPQPAWYSGRSRPLALHVGQAAPPWPEGIRLGTSHLLTPDGRLFRFDIWQRAGDLEPVPPFPPATHWVDFADATNLVAVDALGRLWELPEFRSGWQRIRPAVGPVRWKRLASGQSDLTSAAITENGGLYLWGKRIAESEPVDDPINGPDFIGRVPAPPGSAGWDRVALGSLQRAALTVEGRLYAWGYRILPWDVLPPEFAQGDRSVVRQPQEVPPPGASRWVEVAADNEAVFALANDGRIYAWGSEFAHRSLHLEGWHPADRVDSPMPVLQPPGIRRLSHLVRPRSLGSYGALLAETDDGRWFHWPLAGGIREFWPAGGAARWLQGAAFVEPVFLGDDGGIYMSPSNGDPNDPPEWRLDTILNRAGVPAPTIEWGPLPAMPLSPDEPVDLAFHVSGVAASEVAEIRFWPGGPRRDVADPFPVTYKPDGSGQVHLKAGQLLPGWNTLMLQAFTTDGRVGWSPPLHVMVRPKVGPPWKDGERWFLTMPANHLGDRSPMPVWIVEASSDLQHWTEVTRAGPGTNVSLAEGGAGVGHRFYRIRLNEAIYAADPVPPASL